MLALPGYTVHKLLRTSRHTQIYEAERNQDHRAVTLQVFPNRSQDRARDVFELLRRVAGQGVIEALDLDLSSERPVLVLEAIRGVPLTRRFDATEKLSSFLRIATSSCQALVRIHAAHVVHRGITPESIVIDPTSLDTQFVDFELAAELGSVNRPRGSERSTPHAYQSPEQQGRIRHGIDFRSDLYSLGATLFHLLTQHPPPPARIHTGDVTQTAEGGRGTSPRAQLSSATPRSLLHARELPQALCDIVVRLLQEQPDDRYQLATALLADLAECRHQLDETGRIDAFALDRNDVPARPRFARTPVAREREVRRLTEALERTLRTGSGEVSCIRGPAGIGKSTLVDSLRPLVAHHGGRLAWGKFDPVRTDLPFSGIRGALDSIAQQWLAESDSEFARWSERVTRELGSSLAPLVDLVPDLGFVVGDVPQPTGAATSRESRTLLTLAVVHFLRSVAEGAPPLVLVLDDLQWSDPGSYALIAALLAELKDCPILVIPTLRPDEAAAGDALARIDVLSRLRGDADLAGVRLECLELEPLDHADVARVLSRTLGRSLEDVSLLASRAQEKTGGIPLLVEQFITHLHAEGSLWFEFARGWDWDDAAAASAHIPEGAVGLMLAKLERLAPDTRELLSLASCVADEFSVESLANRTTTPRDPLQRGLWQLCEEGLVVPCAHGYRFAHDRIREAAQQRLSVSDRERLHATAAERLLEATTPEQRPLRALEIADHMQLAGDRLGASVQERATELYLEAASRSLHTGAPETALRFCRSAYTRSSDSDWVEAPARTFECALKYSDCAFQASRFDLALELADELERRPLSALQRARVAALRIPLEFTQATDSNLLLKRIVATFRSFGIRWPARPSRLRELWEFLRTDWALRGPLDERGFIPASRENATWIPAVTVLSASGPALAHLRPELVRMTTAYCIRQFRIHGYLDSPALALAAYAASRRSAVGAGHVCNRYARAAEHWCQTSPDALTSARAQHTLHAVVDPWTRPRRELLPACAELVDRALSLGSVEFACTVSRHYALSSALVGEPLARVEERYLASNRYGIRTGCTAWKLALELLRGDRDPHTISNLRDSEALRTPQRRWTPLLAMALCIAEAHDVLLAEGLCTSLSSVLVRNRVSIPYDLDHLFYHGLSCGSLAARSGAPRASLRRELRRSIRHLRSAAGAGKDFEHMYLGLVAEAARLAGSSELARRRYTLSAQLAHKSGYVQHEALLHERHASLLLEERRRTEAASLLRRALALYTQWGARSKMQSVQSLLDSTDAGH